MMTRRRSTRRRGRDLVAPQEERLLSLLGQAEGHAYALAHSYDIGCRPDRAYAFVAFCRAAIGDPHNGRIPDWLCGGA